MDTDSVQARIEHQTADLRTLYPYIKDCHSALVRWKTDGEERYSLNLDIRWPQHQALVAGESKDSAVAAIAAGFDAARRRVHEAALGSR